MTMPMPIDIDLRAGMGVAVNITETGPSGRCLGLDIASHESGRAEDIDRIEETFAIAPSLSCELGR